MKRFIIYFLTALVAFVTLMTTDHAEAAEQNKVEGTLTVDNETIQLKHVYVFQRDDEISVFMTAAPVPQDKIPYDIGDLAAEGKATGFSVGISKSEKQITAYSYFNLIYHKAVMGGGQMQVDNYGKLEIKTFDENVLGAVLIQDKPTPVLCYDCSEDHTYSYNVAFTVNLTGGQEEAAKPAEIKPTEIIISGADTPPAKAYASYYRAKLTGNIDEVKKGVVKEHVKDLEGEMGKMMIIVSMEMDPKEIKIVETAITDDSARLTIEGINNNQGLATGSVVMALEDGQWKVESDKWK